MKIPSKYKIWRYPLFLSIRYFIERLFNRDSVCLTYWINANTFLWDMRIKPYNWGDYVNIKLAELISGKTVIPSKYNITYPKVAMMGSILPWAMDRDTVVWGSGCLNSQDPLWDKVEKPLNICSVRGPLTRKVLLSHGIECPEIYGDPALLFPKYYLPSIEKKNNIGIIPHVSSLNVYPTDEIKKQSARIIVINPTKFKTWHDFIDQILSCQIVFSSSLHGLIISDAYHIPNVWISLRNDEHPDNMFKFHDYFLSVGKDFEKPISFNDIDFENIDAYLDAYQKPKIDVDKILDVCPLLQRPC